MNPNLKPNANGVYDQDEVRAKIWTKPIREISVDDWVISYDKQGNLVPGKVTRTMQNNATHILDFWGTGVTLAMLICVATANTKANIFRLSTF